MASHALLIAWPLLFEMSHDRPQVVEISRSPIPRVFINRCLASVTEQTVAPFIVRHGPPAPARPFNKYDVDDASQIGPLLGQLEGPVASLTERRRRAESLARASLAGCPAFD